MSIPKIIHYCWFGKNPLPASARKCIRSWKKFCPDYSIVEWNETNFDFSSNLYAAQAYETGNWAFVSDYARLKIIYDHGGIYLDVDVELLRPLDSLLEYDGYLGLQADGLAATGLGFGAVKHHPLVLTLLKDYETIPFIRGDGSFDMLPCPDRSTATLLHMGFHPDTQRIQEFHGCTVFPPEYFSPKDYYAAKTTITPNTYSIHHYSASWLPPETAAYAKHLQRNEKLKRLLGQRGYRTIRLIWRRIRGKRD